MAWVYHNKPPLGWPIDWNSSLARGLVLRCPMNEDSGNIVQDLTKNKIIGTFNANAHFVSGRTGPAVDLDGTDDIIDFGTRGGDLVLGVSEYTVSIWARFDAALGPIDGIISCDQSDPFPFTIRESGSSADGSLEYMQNGNSLESNRKICNEVGVWIHIVAVFSSSRAFRGLYFDGVLDNSDTYSTANTDTGDNLYVGCDYQIGTGREMNGQVDDLTIWNRALTSNEIIQLYRFPFCMFADPDEIPVLDQYYTVVVGGIPILRRRRECA